MDFCDCRLPLRYSAKVVIEERQIKRTVSIRGPWGVEERTPCQIEYLKTVSRVIRSVT